MYALYVKCFDQYRFDNLVPLNHQKLCIQLNDMSLVTFLGGFVGVSWEAGGQSSRTAAGELRQVAGLAGAGVVVDAVHTGGLVEAGALRTLVNVVLTVGTLIKNRKINSDLKVNRNSAGNGGIFTMFGSMFLFLFWRPTLL